MKEFQNTFNKYLYQGSWLMKVCFSFEEEERGGAFELFYFFNLTAGQHYQCVAERAGIFYLIIKITTP